MNNLNSIAFVQSRRRPLIATNDAAVEFDCHPRWLQIQRQDQTFHGQAQGKLVCLSIYLNFQDVIQGSVMARQNDPAQLGSDAIDFRLHEYGAAAFAKFGQRK